MAAKQKSAKRASLPEAIEIANRSMNPFSVKLSSGVTRYLRGKDRISINADEVSPMVVRKFRKGLLFFPGMDPETVKKLIVNNTNQTKRG